MNIQNDEIHVWHKNLIVETGEIEECWKILSSDEVLKANRFKFLKDKNRYLVSRATLRKLLSKYVQTDPSQINFSHGKNGKPFLLNHNLKFNLAHSNEIAVYALNLYNEIGIDVEYMREIQDIFQIAKRFFSENETDELMRTENKNLKRAFFNCWTRKEAYVKAIGDGLSYPLENFSITMRDEDEPEIYWMKDNQEEKKFWKIYNINVAGNYISSLAVRATDKKIVIKNWYV